MLERQNPSRLRSEVPTHHPFKKILGLAYYEQAMNSMEIPGPSGHLVDDGVY